MSALLGPLGLRRWCRDGDPRQQLHCTDHVMRHERRSTFHTIGIASLSHVCLKDVFTFDVRTWWGRSHNICQKINLKQVACDGLRLPKGKSAEVRLWYDMLVRPMLASDRDLYLSKKKAEDRNPFSQFSFTLHAGRLPSLHPAHRCTCYPKP